MDIRWRSLLNCPFAHPTVMMRHQILINNGLNYDEQFKVTEDYNLWSYLLKYTKGFNFNYPLLQYGVRDGIVQTRPTTTVKRTRLYRPSYYSRNFTSFPYYSKTSNSDANIC
jgi:hypothetical protein